MAANINLNRVPYSPEEDEIILEHTNSAALKIFSQHPDFKKCNRSSVAIERRKTKLVKGNITYRNCFKVVQLKANRKLVKIFDNAFEASKHFNSKYDSYRIRKSCINLNTQVFGYNWMYLSDYLKEVQLKEKDIVKKKRTSPNAKKIIQLSISGEYIKTWNAISLAARTLNISRTNISECCNGYINYSGGFIWKHYTDYHNTKSE